MPAAKKTVTYMYTPTIYPEMAVDLVECPTCGAKKGEKCISSSVPRMHGQRMDDAARAATHEVTVNEPVAPSAVPAVHIRRNAAADAYVAARINTLYIYARDARDTDLMALCIDARNGSDSAINEVGSFITDNRSVLSELFDVF